MVVLESVHRSSCHDVVSDRKSQVSPALTCITCNLSGVSQTARPGVLTDGHTDGHLNKRLSPLLLSDAPRLPPMEKNRSQGYSIWVLRWVKLVKIRSLKIYFCLFS